MKRFFTANRWELISSFALSGLFIVSALIASIASAV